VHCARSFVRNTRQAEAISNELTERGLASQIVGVAPDRLSHGGAKSRSEVDPNNTTCARSAVASSRADSANRSGSQRLAFPYAAPGLPR